jgi:transposase
MTFIAALRHNRIDAPFVLDGPVNGASFQAYVEKVLVPTLRPGDVVVMDNRMRSPRPIDLKPSARSLSG